MKKVIMSSSVLLGVILLAGCGKQQTQNQLTTPAPVAQQSQPTQKQPSQPQNVPNQQPKQEGIVYKNDTYGFELTLPKGWEKYTVAVENEPTPDCKDCANIFFQLPSAGVPKIATVFSIGVRDLASAQKIAKTVGCDKTPDLAECPNSKWHLANSAKYSFFYSSNPEVPQDLKNMLIDFVKTNFKVAGM
ncbi:MAG: hypothetical protein A2259_02340 [Candidatus Moranbacteria bacterium RIFOXYA2_FULL_43_15]|nr:MAG: hypothetical protein A2259_02340 [Candidatus Moranbacteria bacterium RIFOXYA2_FULL_43_15]